MQVMPKKPLISVIIPVYKVEQYLDECLISVLNQTYTNLEIIVINDGSPDSSGAICRAYAKKDPRIYYYQQANAGLSSARNTGIDKAQGEYLTFIDSDDYVAKDYIEKLYQAAQRHQADIVVAPNYLVENQTMQPIVNHVNQELVLTPKEAILAQNNNKLMDCIVFIVAWNKLYRREVFQTARFKKGIWHEDEELLYKLYLTVDKVVYTPAVGYYYRIHSQSIMQSGFSLRRLDILAIYHEKIQILTQGNIDTTEIKYQYLVKLAEILYQLQKNNYVTEYQKLKHQTKDLSQRYYHEIVHKLALKRKIKLRLSWYLKSVFWWVNEKIQR